MNVIEKLKKNWKTVLLILLCFLWLKGCVTQCSNNNAIRNDKIMIEQLDSTIHALNDTISIRDVEINQKNIIITEQAKTIERLDRAASKPITVKPPQVIIKESSSKGDEEKPNL